MRIAQVAPLAESVPPLLYGGTERVVSYLTEQLVELGHDVSLYASGDSQTKAKLVAGCSRALWRDPGIRETLPHQIRLLELVARDAEQFDVIHFHCDYVHFPLVRRRAWHTVTTMHGWMHPPDLKPLLDEYSDVPLVSISDDQRSPLPNANWKGTVYHGLPTDLFKFKAKPEGYLAFLGRLSPEKRVDRAIEIAERAGLQLKIAAKIYPEEKEYFNEKIKPLLNTSKHVEYTGEITDREKNEFLGNAKAFLFPIEWPEPFGLVMIEAMACGTPVIAWNRGSVPEVLADKRAGYIVNSIDEAVSAVKCVEGLDRHACRLVFEERFSSARMAANYLRIYDHLSSSNLERK
jgi:glycosyltransferase involved in cell wall biosynthesis